MHLWPTAMDDAENINDNNWESDMHETISSEEIPVSILAQECPENLDPQSVIFNIIMIVLLIW
ncbi:Bgt-4593 [Blumeria graminis f. sp. tritici]|nr:Bgt-4593 [Blumeria graminis f. sp. tritici]